MNANTAATTVQPAAYRVNDVLIDATHRRVTRHDTELALSNLSFELLLTLARAAPHPASIDELMERVWPGLVVGLDTVSQRVKLVREALGDDAEQPRYIATVRGRGYRMVPKVVPVWDFEQLDPTAPPHSPIPDATVPDNTPRVRKRPLWAAVGVLLCLAAAGLWWKFAGTSTASTATHRAIAVMPFVNLTGDPNKDYLADGMAEELIITLSQLPELKIPARSSTFAYRGREVDARRIAKDLGVDALLEGSLRSAGERLRVSAQLIDARNGFQIWSASFDEPFADLFKLQETLATAVAKNLRGKTVGPSVSRPQTPPTKDVAAYNLYLQGASLLERPNVQTVNRAVEYCEQATARDPHFARAYGCLARAHLSFSTFEQLSPMHMAAARAAAERALALDSNVPDAHAVLAGVAMYQGRWLEMRERDQTALQFHRNDGFSHAMSASRLLWAGHQRAGLERAREAYALAPAHPMVVAILAFALVINHSDAEALRVADLASELGYDKGASPLAWTYSELALHRRQYAAAADTLIQSFVLQDSEWANTADVLRHAYTALENPAQEDAALQLRQRFYPHDWQPTGNAISASAACLTSAYAYAQLSALDIAFDLANLCLDRLPLPQIVPGAISTITIWTPEMRTFRQDSRFQAFVTRLGLMPYFEKYGAPDSCELKKGELVCH